MYIDMHRYVYICIRIYLASASRMRQPPERRSVGPSCHRYICIYMCIYIYAYIYA